MDTNKNPFAFLNNADQTMNTKGGGEFDFLRAQEKIPRALNADDLGLLAKEEGAAHLMPVINAIYGQESGAGANSKTSTDGAIGGMQVMPDTFRRFAKQGESIDNPADNMRVGMRIIKSLGDKFGNDPAKIATGYFSGEGNVNAGNGSAWKNDHKDGNGKTVSGYVSDVLGRLSPVNEAKAAEKLPDLGNIPKWSEISTSQKYLSLPDDEKNKLKGAYFDDVLAPHAGSEAAKYREEFMAQRDTAPGFNEKLEQKMSGIVPAVKDIFGMGKTPGAGSVMEGYKPDAAQSGVANLQDTMQTSKTLRDVDGSVENRRARLVAQGEDPRFAQRAAEEAAAAGIAPGAELAYMQKTHGTVGNSGFDFETSEAFNKQAGINNPLIRGAAKAGLGTTKALSGYTQFAGEVLGIDGMQESGKNAGAWARGKEEAIGEKGTFLERNLEGAINSIGQQLPLMIAGVKLETTALPLAGMAIQTFGQEYSDGRAVGQTPVEATQRAAIFSAFEVLGEKLGLGDSMKAIKAAARGMPNDQIVGFLWSALKKEVPGELLTTTGQFGTDKLPTIGLNQNATGEDYLKQVGDTIAQTIMQSGVMAGGTTGVSTAVRYLRDKSDNANVDAIHAEDVRQKSLDRWNAGLLGVPREAVQSVQTPDGRIEPNTAPATPQQTAAAEPAPIDVHPTSAVADSIVADLATQNGIPYEFVLPQQKNKLPGTPESNDVNDQDVLDYAEMRHRQLLAKLHGRIEQVPTDSGLVDQEVPGQALTPEEQAELNTLETQNPSEIRSFYGMNQPIPSDQSANQSFAQTPAPAVAPVEQPAQGSVFPTATEPGLVAAQENQHAQNIPQATPNGSTPSQAAIEPTGQPVRPAQEQQPTGQGAAAQANPVNPVGIANQQVQPDDSVTSEFDVSGRNDQQLSVLATKGQPGWKEAALAELAKRGISQEPAAPKGQFKTADEAQAYIQAQRRRAGSKLPKALPLPHEDGSFGVVTDGQSGWEQAVAYAKANAPKTEKESRERRSSNVKKSYDVWDEDGNKGTINIVRSKDGSLFRIFQIWTNQDGETAQFEQSTGYGEGITDDYIVKAIAEPGDLLLTNPNDKPKTEKEAKAKREKKGVKTASVERMDDGRITLVRHNADGTELSPMYFDDIAQAQRERINWERGTTSHETPLATQESDIDAAATSGFSDAQSGKENRPGSELNDVQVQAYNIGYRRGLEELNSKEPKTEKEAKAKRQQQQSVEPKKATEDSLKAASEWWSVHSAADRKSLLLEQYSEAIAATNSELTWDELGSGMQTRIAELYDARQVKPWTGERKTEQDVKIRRKAEEIHAKANDLLGGTFKLSVDQVETLIHDKGMEVAEQTLAGLKQSVKDAEKRNKTAKPKEQSNGTEAKETITPEPGQQAEQPVPGATDSVKPELTAQAVLMGLVDGMNGSTKIADAAVRDALLKANLVDFKGLTPAGKTLLDRLNAPMSKITIKSAQKLVNEALGVDSGTAGGYTLPEDVHAEWLGSMKLDYVPTARQQMVMDSVQKAMDEDQFYNKDVEEFVAADLGVTPQQRASNVNNVRGGDFGYDVYHAKELLQARKTRAHDTEIRQKLNLKVGDKLGTMIFNTDFKVNTGMTVKSISDDGKSVVLTGKRGAHEVQVTTEPTSITHAIDRAAEKGKRKDDSIQFMAERNKPKTEKEAKAQRATQQISVRDMTEEGRATDGKPINGGDVFRTSSGRETTPYPKQKAEKYASQWLIDNAVSEAEARGDSFNSAPFKSTKPGKNGILTTADRDSMLMYLFGEQPKVVPSITKPLVAKTEQVPTVKSPKAAKTEKSVKADKLKAQLEDHFSPGNIIYNSYWKTHDRVLAFNWNDGNWNVQVEEVKSKDGEWVKAGDKRVHSTRPDAKDAVVERAPAAPETAVEHAPDNVQNFGKELEGGRRNRAPSLDKELSEHEIAGQPLSKIWPADEIDGIEDKFAAAVAFAARAEIPAKPRVGYRVANWAQKVQTLRQLAAGIVRVGSDKARDIFAQAMKGSIHFRAKVALLEAVDRDQWSRIGNVYEYPNSYSYLEDGTKVPASSVSVEIDGKNHRFSGAKSVTEEAILNKVNELLGTEAEDKKMAFEVRGRAGSYFVNKKGDKEYRKLKTFDDSKAAFAYIKDNYADLVAAWDAVKERDNVGKGDVRNAENRPRTGKDWLEGKDVTAQQFIDDLGFRGVEFGKWVGQGTGAKERQGMLNQAYEALMDLATIIGVPPKAISLNGSMGLAFGSRGSGNASAHFEPGNLVINLTKTKGAGTLAHEWFHALDNYFARMRGGEKTMKEVGGQAEYRRQNFVTYKPEPLMVHKTQQWGALTMDQLKRYHAENPKSAYYDPANWKADPKHPEGVRPVVEKAFSDLVNTLNDSPMAKRASRNDKGADGYWGRIIERAARSFENYVIHKMDLEGYQNDYLANVTPASDFKRDADRYPYLRPEEVQPVADAFDNLFKTVETKKTDDGHVTMFSRSKAKAPNQWYQSRLETAIDQAPDRIFGKAAQFKLWLASNAAKLGIKKDEIEWSGINEFLDLRQGSNVPKQDLLEFLSNNGVKVQDVMKHNAGKDLYVEESRDEEGTWLVFDADDNVIEAFDSRKSAEGFLTSATKYGSFTLPGGTNYKELLLTLPDHGAESVHDQRQRLKEKYGVESWFDLTDAQKEDLRKSDEKANLPRVQYKSGHWDEPNILAHVRFNDRTDADGNKVLFIEELQSDWAQAGRKLGFGYKDQTPLTPEEDRELMNLYGMRAYARTEEQTARMHELNNRLNAAQGKSGIPDAPFVKDTKAWVSLAIKRMVAYAAENGYDKVAFVNGKQSADRYSLSKQIDTLHYNPTRQTLVGTKDGLGVVHEIHVSSDKLDSYVGKEVADRLLSQEPNEHGLISLKGQELEVGGEGMKSFYDKIVPQVANDVLKKLGGGKVGLVEVAKNGRSGKAVVAADRGRMKSEGSLYDQLGFTITPEMREMVAKGLPLFSRGKPSQGMALRDLKAIVDRARSSLKNLPQVHVLHTPDGLDMDNPSQERLRKEIYRRGAEYDVEGVSHDGEIYLFSANIVDEFRAEHVLVNHEVGHYGLREVFGRSGLDPIMNTIYMTNAKVRKQADALRKKFGLESNAEATEEVLVEMAPNELIKLNAWRRLVRHVRDWLESHGFAKMAERLNALMKAGMTEQQKADMLVADVVNAARNWVRNGTPSQSSTVQETKLSQADQNDSDLLERDRANIETAARRMGQFVDEFLDGKVKDSDTYILGDTPAVLRALGAEDRKMQIDGYTIHKILDGKHRYFITPDMLKQIPDHLYDPLAVFDSPKDGKPGKIVLTELSDAITGKPVIVAVHLSKKSGRITVNEISSVYETSDGTQRSKLTPEALEYYRNEKSLEQTTTPNLSTPLAGVVQSAQDLGKNILTESDIVKQYGPKFSRKPIGEVVRDLQSNVVQFYGNQDLKTFNGLNRTINTQFHKALKDKDFGRVYNLIQGMQNHVATASARPAELAPGILHRVDNVIQAVKTLVSKSQRQAIEKAGDALFAGTLNGHSVMDGRVWTEAELREKFKLDDTGVALYRQARKAIDASLTELAAAEAYALAENYLPKALRADIIESPEDAGALIVAALGRQIDMARKANLDEDAQAGIADAKEKVQAIFDQADKLKKAGYAPLMRFGKFDLKMMAIDPATGNLERDENDSPVTLYYSRFESQAKLREAERELRDRYADKLDEIRILPGVVNDNANELYRGVNPETLSVFAEAVGARQAMDDYIRLVRSERSAMKRRLERKGTPGYSLDVQRVLANFITSNARQAAQQLFGTSVNNAIRRIPREKGDVQKEALALRDYVINPKDNGALGSSLMFAWFLGGSPAAALVNMTQPVMMTLPHLSQYGTARAAAELTKAVPYAMGAKQITNADLRAALKKASLQGIVDAQEVFHLYAIGSRQMSHWVTKIGLHEATGQAAMTLWGSMFSAVEGMNRRLTFIAAWNVAKARGEANPYEFAVDAVNQTQGIYNKANRPNGARSAVGRAVFTFKTYSIMYTELMHRMWKSGPEGKKAVLLMMAVLILASGIDGLPGAGLLDAIIDRIGQFMGYDTNMRRWKRRHAYELLGKVAGDLVLYGASSMLPLDFGGRLGMGNMIPGSELIRGNYAKGVAEFIGPTAGAARQVGDAIDAAEEGNRVQAAVNLMPKAGRDLFNAIDMGRRGYARDAAGRKTVETTMTDAVVKGFGFNPTVVADRTRASIPIQQDVQLAKKKEASIVHAWAQAIVDGDQGAAKEEGERLKTWNKDNPDTPIRITADQIRSRVALLKTDKNNRITKTAPKEMRGRIGLELLKN